MHKWDSYVALHLDGLQCDNFILDDLGHHPAAGTAALLPQLGTAKALKYTKYAYGFCCLSCNKISR